MKAHHVLGVVLAAVLCGPVGARNRFLDQPQFRVENGHLFIEGPRNISIEAGLSLNVQGQNLDQVVKMIEHLSPQMAEFRDRVSRRGDRRMDGLSADLRAIGTRVQHLEAAVANSSGVAMPNMTQRNNLNRRLRAVERRLRTVERTLLTNECASNPCLHGGVCEDVYNGFICRCAPGWEGTACEDDVNECARLLGTDLGCQNEAVCVNTPGSYRCNCRQGFFGTHCMQSAASCTAGADLCGNGLCVQRGAAAFTCICNQGWKPDPATLACTVDEDECAAQRPACSHDPPVACVNLPGSFRCGACPRGYQGNGYYCTDVDECLTDNGGCSTAPTVQCINTRGSSLCGPCPPGYVGDGRRCRFQGVCGINNGGCHPLARCVSLAGSGQDVLCVCGPGYTGSGVGPGGCEAAAPTAVVAVTGACASAPCRNGATCTNSAGSFTCTCRPGFKGRDCATADPCSSSPCQNGATCYEMSATDVTCDCPDGFTGERCETRQDACGGFLRSEAGTLRFPHSNNSNAYPHGVNCGWVIVTNSSLVLNVTFTHFEVEDSPQCNYDWLQIHDGPTSGSFQIGRFCGTRLPRKDGRIVSTHNSLYLWFRADSSVAKRGFELHWTSQRPQCGSLVQLDSHASISSPGSPGKYPANRDCWWLVHAAEGRRVQLHFYSMQIEDHPNCSYDYLEVRDGMEENSPLLARYCNSSRVPPPLVASSNYLTLHFHSDASGQDAGFQISAAAIEGTPGCGGVLTDPTGSVTAPRSADGNYRPNMHCGWKIQVPLTERVSVDFDDDFDIEKVEGCVFDYVEVYDGADATAPLVGRYCQQKPPRFVSSGNTLYVVFHADPSYQKSGFTFNYQVECGGVFTAPTGEFSSPYYPNPYAMSRRCVYEIRTAPKTAITLEFLDFDVEDNSGDGGCHFDSVTVRDGYSANATAIGTFCGAKADLPDHPLVSTHNNMFIEFVTDSTLGGRGFRANYSIVDLPCGGILKERLGMIETPRGADGNHPADATCSWVLVAPPGHVVQLTFLSLVMEKSRECNFDYVAVFDNSTTPGMGGLLGRFCGKTLPPVMTSTDSVMNVVFRSDKTVNREGFTAHYSFLDQTKVCGAKFLSPSGVATSPNFPNNYPDSKECVYTLRVANGQQIRINFTDFSLEDNFHCNRDFVEIRNGGSERSPLVGKYCGTKAPPVFLSVTNELYIHFKTDSSITRSGFRFTWDSASRGCGGSLTASSGTIHSPNYPQPYGNQAECYWNIAVAQGSVVRAWFTDLETEQSSSCTFDYIELWDGVPTRGKLLGRFCNGRPDPVVSKTHNVYVRFHSDAMINSRGFALDYESTCQASLSGARGVIESPNWPNVVPRANCTWTVTVARGNTLNITFSHMDLMDMAGLPGRAYHRFASTSAGAGRDGRVQRWGRDFVIRQSTPAELRAEQAGLPYQSSCPFSYVLIRDSEKDPDSDEEVPGTELGRFCGTRIPPMVASKTNKVFISFFNGPFSARTGFRLEWVTEGCGGELRRPQGNFSSPNYPQFYPSDRVCEWLIEADWGSSIELVIWDLSMEHVRNCAFDSISVYGGRDDSAPQLGNLCHTEAKPITFTSSSRHMFVRFTADFSYSGRGFTASYRRVASRCGGRLTAPYGELSSPEYPKNYSPKDDCEWTIEVAAGHSVQLTLKDLDLAYGFNCSKNYVQVVDGGGDGPELARLCGSRLAANRSVVASTGSTMTIRMKTDGVRSAKGFLASYATVCGAFLSVKDAGVISSHEAINMAGLNPNCSWRLMAEDPGKHVTLTITQLVVSHLMQEVEGEEDPCAEENHVEVREGLDATGQLLGRFCTARLPGPITSRGSALYVNLVSPLNVFHGWFSAAYSVLSNACGGTYNAEQGAIATPRYPDTYPPGVECEWTIKNSPGNRVQLTFSSFSLAASAGCVDDYLEVREDHGLGAPIGVFCGDDVPDNITSSKSLWIKFRSDASGTAPGFLADFALAHGDLSLSGSKGQIASPLYPSPYAQNADLQWRVLAATPSKVITLTVKDLSTDYADDDCDLVYLAVYDGFDETAPELFKGCGGALPPPMTTTSNVAFVRLFTHPIRRASSFLLEWRETVRQDADAVVVDAEANKCGATVHIPAGGQYNLSSPGYPTGYPGLANCSWVLDTPPGWHLGILFHDMDLEASPSCVLDKVQVHTGEGGGPNWRLLYTLCEPSVVHNFSLATTNFMKVAFLSDWGANGTGFEALVYSKCGGALSGPSGVIVSPNDTVIRNTPAEPSCEWVVTARPGRTLAVTFIDMSIAREAGEAQGPETCGNSYVLLKNGGSEASPLLGEGKYCGNNRPAVPETSGNQLYVRYRANQPKARFALHFEQKASDCSREIRLEMASVERIATPNHPNIPNPHTECVWLVMAPPGHRVRMDFDGRFDISSTSSSCAKSAVELRDGATENSPLIDAFCTKLPGTQESTGNVLRVRYFNDEALPGNGFTANVSVASCGGTIRASSGTVTSPGYPDVYPPFTRCEWRLVVRPTTTMTIAFQDFYMSRSSGACPDNVTVTSLAMGGRDEKDEVLGTVCGARLPANMTSLGNEVLVVLQTGPRGVPTSRGFALRFSSNEEVCGGSMTTPRGTIRSPGYPARVPRQRCVWSIVAPEGRRVTITFTDVDLATRQLIRLYHGIDETVPMRSINSTIKVGDSFESTSNTLVVVLYSFAATSNRGFAIDYNADKPAACGTQLSLAESGKLEQPDANLTSYLCSWRLDAPSDLVAGPVTLAVTVNSLQMLAAGKYPCHKYTTRLQLQKPDNSPLARLCSSVKEPVTFVSPFQSNVVLVNRPWYERSMNYSVDYKWHQCGGVLENPTELTSPGYPARYPGDMHCAWKLVFDEGSQVQVTFAALALRSCDDVLEVHNGEGRAAPKLGPFCHNAEALHSSGRHLWVEFHTAADKPGPGQGPGPGPTTSAGFKLTFSRNARACGGILHGTTGTFATPRFPDNYADNVECTWEVRVARGLRVTLRFVERFHIQERANCSGDHLEVVDYDEEERAWRPLRRLCGRTPLPDGEPLLSSGSRLRLVFRSDGSGAAEGFKAQWDVACGFRRNVTAARPSGELVSPGYPNAYTANLNCTYELLAPGRAITARFTNFSVETAKTCQYDNVTLIRQTDEDPDVPYAEGGHRTVYCDRRPPPAELRVNNRLLFTFQTDGWVQQAGFRLAYELDQCDQDITSPAEIRSPARDGAQYVSMANCTYNITAPPGYVVAIRFSAFVAEMSYDCYSDSLAVYDGPVANESRLLGRFCGNLTASLPRLQSTGRGMLLRWQTDATITADGFVAHVWFFSGDCGTVTRAGKTTPLAPASALQIGVDERLVIQMKHPRPFQHCDWSLTAQDGYGVQVALEGLDLLAPCPNATLRHRDRCGCSYLQALDGLSQYADSMGRYCRGSPPRRLTSSDRSLLLRLVAGPAEQAVGEVVIRASTVRSACGPTAFRLNENVTEIILNSPGFPATPPAALRCVWTVETQNAISFVNITTLDLNGPAGCRGDGHLTTGRLDIYKDSMGSWTGRKDTVVGRQLNSMAVFPGMPLESFSDPSPRSFCDNKKPPTMTFGMFTSSVRIVYDSGEQPVGKGFQLVVKATKGCPPAELNEAAGNVVFPFDQLRCTVRIVAPANHTVTFVMSDQAYLMESANCADGAVQILDGVAATSPSIATVCGSDMRRAFSSTGPGMAVTYWKKDDTLYSNVEGWYYTTDQGPGCGGTIFRESGYFSSPMFPAPYRNKSTCRWEIEVPGARNPVLQFRAFDLGANAQCSTDFVKVFDVNLDGSEEERATFCGQVKPAVVRGATHRLAITYTTSALNGGTGWFAEFMGLGTGEHFPVERTSRQAGR